MASSATENLSSPSVRRRRVKRPVRRRFFSGKGLSPPSGGIGTPPHLGHLFTPDQDRRDASRIENENQNRISSRSLNVPPPPLLFLSILSDVPIFAPRLLSFTHLTSPHDPMYIPLTDFYVFLSFPSVHFALLFPMLLCKDSLCNIVDRCGGPIVSFTFRFSWPGPLRTRL